MAGIIKIKDAENRCLAFDLYDLVSLVSAEGPHFMWGVFDLKEVTFKDCSGLSRESGLERTTTGLSLTEAQLYRRVEENPGGWIISWSELLVLADLVLQTIEGTYVGCVDAGVLLSMDHDYLDDAGEAFYSAIEIAFQAVDSSYWLVYSKSDAILTRISNHFADVTPIKFW